MSLEEDITWLLSICKKPESLKYLEPTAHAFSIFFALRKDIDPNRESEYTELEVAKLSMVGIVATTARLNDNNKFHSLDPQSFLQVANMLLDEKHDGTNYAALVKKVTNEDK